MFDFEQALNLAASRSGPHNINLGKDRSDLIKPGRNPASDRKVIG